MKWSPEGMFTVDSVNWVLVLFYRKQQHSTKARVRQKKATHQNEDILICTSYVDKSVILM